MLSRFDREIRPVITDEAAALSATLHEAVAAGLAVARTSARPFPHEKFPHLLPMHVRCAVRMDLEQRALPRGWTPAGDSRLMGQLMLHNEDLRLDLRFLKERRRTYPGGVSPAGRNPTRQHAWREPESLPFSDEDFAALAAIEPVTTVLWVWDFEGEAEDPEGGFVQRLVHTIEPGVFGRAVPCDLSLDLLPGGGIFDRLAFAGGDHETDFFPDAVELGETAEDGE